MLSTGTVSFTAVFLSSVSEVDEGVPIAGEAIRELADGSRLAVRAAFNRFSTSSESWSGLAKICF
jgi:hypothetical protein